MRPRNMSVSTLAPPDHKDLATTDLGPANRLLPEFRRLFALVIGINRYGGSAVPPLRGAVPDANAVLDYLRTKLQVPADNIRCLLDNAATRAAIIDEIISTGKDPRIAAGDPILIYFAGHGGEAEPPSTWRTSKIQTLIPYDFGTTLNGQTVPSIPDRTLGALLRRLAEVRGDNITVVLDCCHSGSGTRTSNADPTRLTRGVSIPEVLPVGVDSSILNFSGEMRHAEIAPGFLHQGLRSHVLLAACGSNEVAMEQSGRGVFTVALLHTLSAVGTHQVTYRDLLQRMYALPGQNPQCEGYFQDRALFNSKLSTSRLLHVVRRDAKGLTLAAGSVSGITSSSQYAIYQRRDDYILGIPPLGNLRVTEVQAVESTLTTTSGHPTFTLAPGQTAYALQSTAGTDEYLRLYIVAEQDRSFLADASMRCARNGIPRALNVQLVDKASADLEIAFDASGMHAIVLHPLIASHGLQALPFHIGVSPSDVCETLGATSHFFWHLKRSSPQQPLQGRVRVEFKKLREVPAGDELDDPTYEPYGPDLNVGGTVDLLVDDDAVYGINIVNDTSLPLYPSLFYFSSSDLSITSYYEPASAGIARVDPPLEPYGCLTIGYGSAGAVPYNYYLWEKQELDVGFLKLFLSTEYADLSHIAQGSPFHGDRRGGKMTPVDGGEALWDTSLVTVIQRIQPVIS